MSVYSTLILAHASLRAYWRLGDANQAAGLQDAGPNNLDGSYPASGVTYGVTGAIANDSDTAVTFDGTASATVPDDNALDLGDGPFSIEFWFKRSATQDAVQVLLAKGTNAPLIRFNASNVLQMLRNGGASVVNAGTFTDQNVHHAVFTWDGASDSVHAYVDGVDVSSGGDQTETLASTAQVFRIAAVSATQQFYSGTLDEIAIYGAVLSSTEVLEHYQVGKGIIGNAGAVTVSGQDATVSLSPTVAVPVADVAVAGQSPEPKVSLEATAADVTASGLDSTPGVGVEVPTAQIAVEGFDPVVAGDRTVSVDTAEITVAGLDPTVSTGAQRQSGGIFAPAKRRRHVRVRVSPADIYVAGLAPTPSISLPTDVGIPREPDTELEDLELLALA